jgi:hypothetical protein
MDVRNLGIPAMTFITEPFRKMAATLSKATIGKANVPIIVLPPVFETSASDTGPKIADEFWSEITDALRVLDAELAATTA